MIFMLEGKVVLVTGASRGIGRATALMAAQNHAKVIVNYNNSEDKAAELVDMIREQGYEATMIKADVSNEDEVKQMFKQIKKDYSRIDVLVNNAGVMINNLLMMTKLEEYEKVIDTNCKGIFLCTRQATKMMTKQKSGKIINMSSVVGVNGNHGQSIYSASKSFVIGFTKATAKELGRYGITVNAVAPGFIETDLTKDTNEKTKKELMSNITMGRFGTPEDIAKVVLFLSSELSDYVSGQIIGVDGCQIM
jgi:3-oxoacyl-[acyl-carrier protein] reductase